jgi:hypothetical protein
MLQRFQIKVMVAVGERINGEISIITMALSLPISPFTLLENQVAGQLIFSYLPCRVTAE